MNAARLCRAAAIALMVVGVVNPAISATRVVKPIVAVLETSREPAHALTDRVVTRLASRYAVVRGASPDAVAAVSVGDDLPPLAATITTPVFVVTPASAAIAITAIDAPARAHVDTHVPLTVWLHASHARGQAVTVRLEAAGAVVDTATRTIGAGGTHDASPASGAIGAGPGIGADDAIVGVPLSVTPTSTGLAFVRVTATLDAAQLATEADTLIRIDARPWPVLVFDRRPSWMSTFVRRALEADTRFAVTSRTATSRDVVTDTPNAPATLNDTAALARFDAIVIGAPDALSPADVAALDAFMRRRGGAVALLWDDPPTGPAAALAGVTRWSTDELAADTAVDTSAGALRVSELAWPTSLPPRAQVLAPAGGGESASRRALVWSAPIGQGRLLVSGALDSWRYRSVPNAAFDRVWPSFIGRAADLAPPPVTVRVNARVVRPGAPLTLDIHSRDAGGEYADSAIPAARVSARLVGPNGATLAPVRVWPGAMPGTYTAAVEAPAVPGDYHVVASVGRDRAGSDVAEGDADVRVQADASGAEAVDALAPWTSSRGGAVFDAAHLDALDHALGRALTPVSRIETVHPMRSPWWIAPITLLTSIDWWTRRRRGLR